MFKSWKKIINGKQQQEVANQVKVSVGHIMDQELILLSISKIPNSQRHEHHFSFALSHMTILSIYSMTLD